MNRAPLATRPRTQVYAQPPTISWVEWDVTAIKHTLREHEEGIFYGSGLLADWMLRDERVKSAIGTRVRAVQGLPFSMAQSPAAQNPDLAKTLATDALKVWPRIMPRAVQGETLRWSAMQGISVAQVLWDASDGSWVPTLEWWHPMHIWWRWDINRLVVNTTTGPVVIEPGDGNWFVHAPNGIYRGWMHGSVRSLAFLVALRQYALRDHGRASEMYGLGIRVGKIPANCDPDDRDRFVMQMANLASEGILLLPQGEGEEGSFEFDIVALEGTFSGALFTNLGERCDTGIVLDLLGQTLTSEVKEGSLAAARVHGDVKQDYLESDVGTLAADVREQLLVPWAWYNYGAPIEDVPDPTWDVTPPEDKDASSKTMGQVSVALTGFVQIGLGPVLDVRAILEKHGIPLLPGVTPVLSLPPAPAGPPNAFDNPGALPAGLRAALAKLAAGGSGGDGQRYADDVASALRDKAALVMAGDVRALLDAIEGADSYDEIRSRLAQIGKTMKPDAFAELLEKASVLAHLAGRHAVREEV